MIKYLNLKFLTLFLTSILLMFLPTTSFFQDLTFRLFGERWLSLSFSMAFSYLALYFFMLLAPKTKTEG